MEVLKHLKENVAEAIIKGNAYICIRRGMYHQNLSFISKISYNFPVQGYLKG